MNCIEHGWVQILGHLNTLDRLLRMFEQLSHHGNSDKFITRFSKSIGPKYVCKSQNLI